MSVKKQAQNGKPASTIIKNGSSKASANRRPTDLERKLAAVFDYFNSARDRQRRHWFTFHMTECSGDCEKLGRLYDCPNEFSNKEAAAIVAGALYHALNHITAGARLLLDYAPGDIFKQLDESAMRSPRAGKTKAKKRRA